MYRYEIEEIVENFNPTQSSHNFELIPTFSWLYDLNDSKVYSNEKWNHYERYLYNLRESVINYKSFAERLQYFTEKKNSAEAEVNELSVKIKKENLKDQIAELDQEFEKAKKAKADQEAKWVNLEKNKYTYYDDKHKIEDQISLWDNKIKSLQKDIKKNKYSNPIYKERDQRMITQYEKFKLAEEEKLNSLLNFEERSELAEQAANEIPKFEKEYMRILSKRADLIEALRVDEASLANLKKKSQYIYWDYYEARNKEEKAREEMEESAYNLSFLPTIDKLAPLKRKIYQLYLDDLYNFGQEILHDLELSNKLDFETEEEMEAVIAAGEGLEDKVNKFRNRVLYQKENFGTTIKLCFKRIVLEKHQNDLQYWMDRHQYRINNFNDDKVPLWKQSRDMPW